MTFIIRVGEALPADGIVVSGKAFVEESSVTGEPLPIEKEKGSEVISGSVLQSGFLHIKATKDVDKSTQGRVAEAVKRAKGSRSATQEVVSKFTVWYTPAVIVTAAIVGLAEMDGNKFLTILVAGCPCGLLGAAPLVYSTVIAMLAQRHKLLV